LENRTFVSAQFNKIFRPIISAFEESRLDHVDGESASSNRPLLCWFPSSVEYRTSLTDVEYMCAVTSAYHYSIVLLLLLLLLLSSLK